MRSVVFLQVFGDVIGCQFAEPFEGAGGIAIDSIAGRDQHSVFVAVAPAPSRLMAPVAPGGRELNPAEIEPGPASPGAVLESAIARSAASHVYPLGIRLII